MAMDWILGWWDDPACSTSDAPPYGLQEYEGPVHVLLDLVTAAQLEQYGDTVIVERIVGNYLLYNRSDYSFLMNVRCQVTQPNQVFGQSYYNIWDGEYADDRFLWQKISALALDASNMANSNWGIHQHPEFNTLDIRVNRRLSDMDNLSLIFAPRCAPSSVAAGLPNFYGLPFDEGFDRWYLGAWIRVLIKF